MMPLKDFTQRVLVLILLIVLTLILFQLKNMLLLLFAAILFAIVMRAIIDFVKEKTGLRENVSFLLVLLFTILLIVGLLTLFGLQIKNQLSDLIQLIPKGIQQLSEKFQIELINWNEMLNAPNANEMGDIVKKISAYSLTTVGIVADLVLVLVGAIFLAADPATYRNGALLMVPPSARENLENTMLAIGQALKKWFGGQLIEMIAVFLMSLLAYWLLELPSFLGLAIIAGIANFIPMIGPIIGGVIAAMVAATLGVPTLLWTLAAVLLIQQIENHLLMPFVQRYAVNIPPALVIFAILGFSSLFGIAGAILGVPLAVALTVVVQSLWVNETLGEDVALAGSEEQPTP